MTDDPTTTLLPSVAPKRKPPAAGMGRIKGVPNKTTVAVKTALIEAFDKLGGVPSLVAWGQSNPTDFYKLWAKLLPTEVTGPGGGPIQVQTDVIAAVATLSVAERSALRAMVLKLEGTE